MGRQYEVINRDGKVRTIDEDDDFCLQDGERLRVPQQFMDAATREVLQHLARKYPNAGLHDGGLHDGLGNPAGYKRGYVFGGGLKDNVITDADRQRVADAYAEGVHAKCNAWRGPHNPVPPKIVNDSPERAYRDHCDWLQNAWRPENRNRCTR